MRVTVLGSGSAGNSILVESAGTRILVDAGFSGRDLERRLAEVDVAVDSVDALLITHDHGDHTRGMGVLARRWGMPLYITDATRRACAGLLRGDEHVGAYSTSEPVVIGELLIDAFLTVHDAADPIAVTVTEIATGEKMGIATDLGRPTTSVKYALRLCDLLIVESNHDEILLRESPYPWSVKARIASSHGHLSNRASAELAAELCHDGLAAVVLAHLSEKANEPELAMEVVGDSLARRGYAGELRIGVQDRPLQPIDITDLKIRRAPPQLSLL
jgi:phosphoribosyl 1,2-cyclic phosphodiesterase